MNLSCENYIVSTSDDDRYGDELRKSELFRFNHAF